METNQNPVIKQLEQFEQGDLIVIYWWDAFEEAGWTKIPLIEAQRKILCKSVGWYLSFHNGCVRILSSINGGDTESAEAGYILIPHEMVKSIEKVRDDEIEVE